ncbi:TolC family protein [Aquincola sp. S2]|uniref:TolC family protein n=1 Tax=Pseudaquabacterium terrae TaxID=2732868 RepID=A0ABX2EQ92_9BURK|nr:TolC family protein [Aquabacterium terrae]NRF70705.1 TolC family protein [Aquabacterium terrae]
MNLLRSIATVAAAALLAGCASFSDDGGFGAVSELTRERSGHAPAWQRGPDPSAAVRARVAELLNAPLDADTAAEVALLNHRGLQARFAELGIAEAELVRAGRLRNPGFSFSRMRGAFALKEIERSLMFDVLGLLTLPSARAVGERQFEQAQLQAAADAVGAATEARLAFFGAVAAAELLRYHEQVKEAADASSELARRMQQAGNFSTLAQLREQSFQADATAQLARANQEAVAGRERLARALGLAQTTFRLPERLPELPAQPPEPRGLEQAVIDRRLDVLMARRAAEATARNLGLTKATRMVNVLELGYRNKSTSFDPRENGWEIELELPLFDFGGTRVARAESLYLQALHQVADTALNARSEVREADAARRGAYALARHYRDEVVPLKKRISEENLLRYNGMLISVFELLADAREQVHGVSGYVHALRDFWIAETQLQAALAGRSPGAAP